MPDLIKYHHLKIYERVEIRLPHFLSLQPDGVVGYTLGSGGETFTDDVLTSGHKAGTATSPHVSLPKYVTATQLR